MKSLNEQFRLEMIKAYEREDDSLREHRNEHRMLDILLIEYRHKETLIEYVLQQISKGRFILGDTADNFFRRCADEIFFENLHKSSDNKIKDSYLRMKRLHPLWGESWWTR